ncbi:hypothetical protein FRUB_04890 [Fimbriiglobus ruber]|uniref:Uncharacterized protein n=1 Tax=Fimbriiglobus ruber TaxID=1908690 RepID=A0A225DQW4_9BACT|nr:hypothetical protein FRUB_04890 [Fimbriiglobus ruber]
MNATRNSRAAGGPARHRLTGTAARRASATGHADELRGAPSDPRDAGRDPGRQDPLTGHVSLPSRRGVSESDGAEGSWTSWSMMATDATSPSRAPTGPRRKIPARAGPHITAFPVSSFPAIAAILSPAIAVLLGDDRSRR